MKQYSSRVLRLKVPLHHFSFVALMIQGCSVPSFQGVSSLTEDQALFLGNGQGYFGKA